MKLELKRIPVGYEDYKELVEGNFYYVDKTLLIKELLDNYAKAHLFTRPRRFGKSLNLSMLRYFFEKPVDGSSNVHLFADKKIAEQGEQYIKYQEQYPVIMLSLKSGKQANYENSLAMLKLEICKEYKRHRLIVDELTDVDDQKRFLTICSGKAEEYMWLEAIAFLSRCLKQYYKKKVVILIDEYDVPLENAFYCGFYEQMTSFIRSLFESALKTNPALEFAVITGCLRISRESIFTGLNNLWISSILDERYAGYFGFVQEEVDCLLGYYGLLEKTELIKEWYDGYRFGRTEVYNPWSVINFVIDSRANVDKFPSEYWSNTSSNSIVRDLIFRADSETKQDIENLINGGMVRKQLHENITYGDINHSSDNLWNFLFFTGYLKLVSIEQAEQQQYLVMKIPNIEIKNIYRNQISDWFHFEMKERNLSVLYKSLLDGNAQLFQKEINYLLRSSISYMDNLESFYHGFIMGLLINMEGAIVRSNREAGNGRYDICVKPYDIEQPSVILEFKIADKYERLDEICNRALDQIAVRNYDVELPEEGYRKCIYTGIGFFRKVCRVKTRIVELSIDFDS